MIALPFVSAEIVAQNTKKSLYTLSMSPLFGKKNPTEETVLIVDIENGSVGCALVRRSQVQPPKLFAEIRIQMPLLPTRSAERVLVETEKALREALTRTAATAARMRNNQKLVDVGVVSSAITFVAAPWTSMHSHQGGLGFSIEPLLIELVRREVAAAFGDIPQTFNPTSSAVVHATNSLFEQSPDLLLSTMMGELTELTLLRNGVMSAHATLPLGKHFLLRTLQTHGGLSRAEAESVLSLARRASVETPVEEAFHHAGSTFASQFSDVAKQFDTPVSGILSIAHEPLGEWAARALATHARGDLFNEQTVVQALHTRHLTPFLSAHASRPDLMFMIEALFIDSQR
jgi:hypothetical protein